MLEYDTTMLHNIHRYRCKKHNSVYLKLFANYKLYRRTISQEYIILEIILLQKDGMTLMTSNVTFKAHPGIGLEGNIIFKDM